MTERPPLDSLWRHKGNGKVYVVTDVVKFEDPATGEWIDAVGYVAREDDTDFTLYVRSLLRFAERFEMIKP